MSFAGWGLSVYFYSQFNMQIRLASFLNTDKGAFICLGVKHPNVQDTSRSHPQREHSQSCRSYTLVLRRLHCTDTQLQQSLHTLQLVVKDGVDDIIFIQNEMRMKHSRNTTFAANITGVVQARLSTEVENQCPSRHSA